MPQSISIASIQHNPNQSGKPNKKDVQYTNPDQYILAGPCDAHTFYVLFIIVVQAIFLIRGMNFGVLDERRKRDHNLREHMWSGIGKKQLTP